MWKLISARNCLLALSVASLAACTTSQVHQQTFSQAPEQLKQQIAQMDAALFAAFNHCDIARFTALLTPDVEFYHDESGRMLSAQSQTDSLKILCAEQLKNGKLRRELVQSSLEVYPVGNYGAVEIGTHNFYRTLPGKPEKLTTVAKFVHIWQQDGQQWRVSRIISYAHSVPD
jgi:ketosteroid isomerase-like protein